MHFNLYISFTVAKHAPVGSVVCVYAPSRWDFFEVEPRLRRVWRDIDRRRKRLPHAPLRLQPVTSSASLSRREATLVTSQLEVRWCCHCVGARNALLWRIGADIVSSYCDVELVICVAVVVVGVVVVVVVDVVVAVVDVVALGSRRTQPAVFGVNELRSHSSNH